ncbi:MAG: SDR family NAD(P)-dependent oxidoreductase, partial [Mycobacterium sp.]
MGRVGRVEGKVALISGGARGMGASHARLLVEEGAKVVIGDILDDEGKALAAEINATGDAARYVHLDVTQPDQWDAAVATATSEFGKLDVLVNNAGIVALGQLKNFDLAKWQKVIDVNLTGTFLGMRVAVEPMTAAGGGSIINVSSIEGLRGAPAVHPYVASKWAVRGLAKSAALELAPLNIRVNSIHP